MDQAPVHATEVLRLAQVALQEGRFADALPHVSSLIPGNPNHPEVLALIAALVAASPGPDALVPVSPPYSYGDAAIRVYALGKVGRAAEAFPLFRDLVNANPKNGIIDWALPWLRDGQLGPDARAVLVPMFLSADQQRWGNERHFSDDHRNVVNAWLPHLRDDLATRPLEDQLFFLYIPMLRKAGAMDEALALAQARHQAMGDYSSAVNLATTFRDAKRFDEWLAATHEIFRLAPDDISTLLDAGDCYWDDQNNPGEAERWYARALRVSPGNDWGYPSLLAVRYLRTKDPHWLEMLEDYQASNPNNNQAYNCVGRLIPFFGYFLEPGDASTNNMRTVAEKLAEVGEGATGTVTLTTTGLDVPSCRRAIDRQVERWGGKIALKRDIRGIQSPDPREPLAPVRHRSWGYDGLTPVPLVSPPSARAAELVGRMAATGLEFLEWCSHPSQMGVELNGPECVPDMLGVMVHPPTPPDGRLEWDWTIRVQVAAALVIGFSSQEWEGSLRKEVLFDLANGPLDWTTGAVVVALTRIARGERAERPEIGRDVSRLLWDVYQRLPRPGSDWYETVILNSRLHLPGITPEERDETRAARRELAERRGRTMSAAEMASELFLARPLPAGAAIADDLPRLAVKGFMSTARDEKVFYDLVQVAVRRARSAAAAAEGEWKSYLDEQLRALELIAVEAPAEQAADATGMSPDRLSDMHGAAIPVTPDVPPFGEFTPPDNGGEVDSRLLLWQDSLEPPRVDACLYVDLSGAPPVGPVFDRAAAVLIAFAGQSRWTVALHMIIFGIEYPESDRQIAAMTDCDRMYARHPKLALVAARTPNPDELIVPVGFVDRNGVLYRIYFSSERNNANNDRNRYVALAQYENLYDRGESGPAADQNVFWGASPNMVEVARDRFAARCVEPGPGPANAQEELRLAQVAIQEGRPADAVPHLVNLLPQYPIHPSVTELLEAWAAATPDPLTLLPVGPTRSYGEAALQVYALGKTGRAAEGFPLFRRLVERVSGNGLIFWAFPWLRDGHLGPDERAFVVPQFFAACQAEWGNPRGYSDEQRARVEQWLPILRADMVTRPIKDQNFVMYIPMLRKAGGVDEAIELARARHKAVSNSTSAVSLAAALRDAKRFDEWLAVATGEVLRLRPNDVPTLLDMGDCYWEDQHNPAEAERWYAKVLRVSLKYDGSYHSSSAGRQYEWAYPSLLAVRYLRTKYPLWLELLEEYHTDNPQNNRTFNCVGRVIPFYASFFDPDDPATRILQEVDKKLASEEAMDLPVAVTLRFTGLEAPSCLRAIDRQFERWGGRATQYREIGEGLPTAPRGPFAPVRHRLWSDDGLSRAPSPLLSPPSQRATDVLRQVAPLQYDIVHWSGYAKQVIGILGADCALEMLAVMAHPPAAPDGSMEWDWAIRVQFAATMVIGFSSQEWEGSLRKEILFDLVNGPLDWPTAAAVVTLVRIANQEKDQRPEIAQDVIPLLFGLYRNLPQPGAEWYEAVVLNHLLQLPGLAPLERQEARAARRKLADRLGRTASEAETAAHTFLARTRPDGVEDDLAGSMIRGFVTPAPDYVGFRDFVKTAIDDAWASLETAEGEVKEYLTERRQTLELIQTEFPAPPAPMSGWIGSIQDAFGFDNSSPPPPTCEFIPPEDGGEVGSRVLLLQKGDTEAPETVGAYVYLDLSGGAPIAAVLDRGISVLLAFLDQTMLRAAVRFVIFGVDYPEGERIVAILNEYDAVRQRHPITDALTGRTTETGSTLVVNFVDKNDVPFYTGHCFERPTNQPEGDGEPDEAEGTGEPDEPYKHEAPTEYTNFYNLDFWLDSDMRTESLIHFRMIYACISPEMIRMAREVFAARRATSTEG